MELVMHAIGYLRVSTDDQTNGNGMDAQRDAIETEAARRGWTLEWASDPGCSGSHVNPGLRAALEKLATGQADALIVAKLDRLARSVRNAADILDAARDQGWDLVVCDLGMDLSTPAGEAMANMLATFAQFERRMISQRTKEGLAAAKRRGKHIGRPRLASSAVVRRIVEARETGASFGAIARTLTDEDVLSPSGRRVWQASSVRRIYNAATKERAA